ncbi:hypothetical protein BUALT_Bualt14G0042300 [Buddleja alternifolia]|uniref:F-box associated beta-propeller type 1 domain-containing protein n=1 Tax=Buddleja alternifolia TaxID=168488 RepID=A0AAV6WGS7_9LAMI|nr:hypothetical protein BUALT_Bualt14G0042300 [Buddleja alternifolia]
MIARNNILNKMSAFCSMKVLNEKYNEACIIVCWFACGCSSSRCCCRQCYFKVTCNWTNPPAIIDSGMKEIASLQSGRCGRFHKHFSVHILLNIEVLNGYTVFSYKNNSWTKELATMKTRWGPGLFVNGALYWVAREHCQLYGVQAKEDLHLKLVSKRCDGFHYRNLPIYDCSYGYGHEIYYFDSKTDKFKKLPKPECLEDHSSFNLTTLGGHLCLYRNTYDLTRVEIWMMETYKSWMKLMMVENVPIDLQWSYHVKPLCLTNKGEVVLDISYSHFVVYNPKEKKFGDTNRNIHMALSPLICLDTFSLPTESRELRGREMVI